MKTYVPDLTYFGPDYPDPPGPEKVVKYLEAGGWLWDRVWQPRWKNWLFGPKYMWFGPVGTSWFLNSTPPSIVHAAFNIEHFRSMDMYFGIKNEP